MTPATLSLKAAVVVVVVDETGTVVVTTGRVVDVDTVAGTDAATDELVEADPATGPEVADAKPAWDAPPPQALRTQGANKGVIARQ